VNSAVLVAVLAGVVYLLRRFSVRVIRSDFSPEWWVEHEAKQRREAMEWAGVGYEGKFKR